MHTNSFIRFGPSGNSESFYQQGFQSSHEAPKWLHDLGLSAYEYSFGRGVRLQQSTAEKIGEAAALYDIQLSVHLPYYINLATADEEKILRNTAYFLESARAAQWLKAKRGVFHPGSAKPEPKEAFLHAKQALQVILSRLDQEGFGDFILCPETMGKINQLGDVDETLSFCRMNDRLIPCLDFAHIHARTRGGLQSRDDFAAILDKVENELGLARARNIHIHFCRIEFTQAGEKRHHTFAETIYGPEFMPLAKLLVQRQYAPVVVCESKGSMAEDALAMQNMYESATKPCSMQ